MLASGVRRSCDTAASRAVRARLSLASDLAPPWPARTSSSRCRIAPARDGERRHQPAVGPGQHPPGEHQHAGVVDRGADRGGRAWPPARNPRSPRPRSRVSARCRGRTTAAVVDGEELDRLSQQGGQLVALAQEGLGGGGQGAGLALGRAGSCCSPFADVDHRGDRRRDDDEHEQGDEVLRVGDRQGVDRLGEEPVDGQAPEDGRGQRRPQAAHEGGEDGEQEEEEHLERQVVPPGRGPEYAGQRGRADHGQRPADRRAPRVRARGRSAAVRAPCG